MAAHSIDEHFAGKGTAVRETYDALLHVARAFGTVGEEAKKTSIHLVARTAFAGVVPRREKIVLTIKSPVDVKSARVAKCERLSANRWHFEVHLSAPSQVDDVVEGWLRRAYEISR
jgi:hypothetical protein